MNKYSEIETHRAEKKRQITLLMIKINLSKIKIADALKHTVNSGMPVAAVNLFLLITAHKMLLVQAMVIAAQPIPKHTNGVVVGCNNKKEIIAKINYK